MTLHGHRATGQFLSVFMWLVRTQNSKNISNISKINYFTTLKIYININVKISKVKRQSYCDAGLAYVWKTALWRKALLLPQGFLTEYGFFNS